MSSLQSIPQNSQLSRVLSVLNRIGQMVTAIGDPRAILQQIANDARDVLEADLVDLYEYDPGRNEFVLPPVFAGTRRVLNVPKPKIYDDDVVVKVLRAGHSQYNSDSQGANILVEEFENPRQVQRFVIREGIVSSVSLPLQAGGESVGVMFVNYREPQEFGAEQRELIESFSNLAAITLHTARLWETQTEQTRRLEALHDTHSRQFDAIKDIIDALGSSTMPVAIILERAAKLFKADHGNIGISIPASRELIFDVHWTDGKCLVGDEVPPEKRRSNWDIGITGYVARTGQPRCEPDVTQAADYVTWYPQTKSELTVPLIGSKGKVLGVLDLESDSINAFDDEQVEMCQRLASLAAIVIEKSEFLTATDSLNAQLEILHDIALEKNLDEALRQVARGVNKIMGAKRSSCSITRFDERDNRFLPNVIAVGPLEHLLNFPPRAEAGEAWYVAKYRQALYIESKNQLPPEIPELNPGLRDAGVQSSAALPLIRHERLIGVLFIHVQQPVLFSEELRRSLETYANQAAIAIENARQYELRIRDMAALQEINEALVSQNPRVLDLIVNQALSVMPAEYCSLWMGDSETDDLVLRAYQGPPEDLFLPSRPEDRRLKAGEPSISMEVFRTGKAIMVSDVNQETGRYKRYYKYSRSQLAVPLKYRDLTIGTLNVESRYPDAFDGENAKLLDSFADQAAVAIKVSQGIKDLSQVNQNLLQANQEIQKQKDKLSRANDRLERRNASFEALTEIGQQLTANIQQSEREILSIIHQQASQIMDTGNMFIALYTPEIDQVHFELAYLDEEPVDVDHEPEWMPRAGGQGRTEWIIHNNAPILTYTRQEAEQWYQRPKTQNYIQQTFASWLGVPITFGDAVLGVIATYHKTEEFKYDPDDLKILTLMGRQAAIALQNARLVRQLDRRIVELNTISELGEDLSKSALSI